MNTESNNVDGAEKSSQNEEGVVLRINKDELVPQKFDDHEHQYVKDPTDETDDYYAVTCIKCPLGRLIKK